MDKTEKELLQEISCKLDHLIAVLATQGRTQDQQVRVLRSFGYDWNFIASIVGLTSAAARKRHSRSTKGVS